jgi:RNA polymerase sigma-70 factor (ECF subfamily)
MSRQQDVIQLTEQEQVLIAAFISGEMEGFKFVYNRYRQRVMSYCVYYMGSQTLAEDAFQEVFSRVYTRREQLREAKALKSWLLLITRSVCLNMLRQSKFTPDFVSLTPDEEGNDPVEKLEATSDPAQSLQADDMLKTMLARLAPIYREAFLMREFEGYDYEQIAEMTGTTEMNVKVRITRAKKQLRQLLAPYYKSRAAQSGRKSRRAAEEAMEESVNLGDEAIESGDFELPENLGLNAA